MADDGERQRVAVISPGGSFDVPATGHVRIERFSILDDHPRSDGQRVTVIADAHVPTLDRGPTGITVAVASFVIGRDYDEPVEFLIGPADRCTLRCIGVEVPVQVIYSVFP
jgi:hypothetical protein